MLPVDRQTRTACILELSFMSLVDAVIIHVEKNAAAAAAADASETYRIE